MKTLVFLDYFTPAFKAGGPIRIFEALAGAADEHNQVGIVTQNTDWGDPAPLAVPEGDWQPFASGQVLYLGPRRRGFGAIRKVLREARADAIHLNSLFSRTWTMKILILRFFRLVRGRTFLSPHGELAASALGLKSGRKRVFLGIGKGVGLFRGLTWIATSPKEVDEIRTNIGASARVLLVPPPLPAVIAHASEEKAPGRLRLVFLARLSAMKNVGFLRRILPALKGDVMLDLYGPVDPEFAAEWRATLASLQALPSNIRCHYKGPVRSTESMATLARYDLFIQPSLSENFGYSIVEALAAGTPALISDRTPWTTITPARAGAALPLERVADWHDFLQKFIDMDDVEWEQWSRRSQDWVRGQNTSAQTMLAAYAESPVTAPSSS